MLAPESFSGKRLLCLIKYFVRSLGVETDFASMGAGKRSSNLRLIMLLCNGRGLEGALSYMLYHVM